MALSWQLVHESGTGTKLARSLSSPEHLEGTLLRPSVPTVVTCQKSVVGAPCITSTAWGASHCVLTKRVALLVPSVSMPRGKSRQGCGHSGAMGCLTVHSYDLAAHASALDVDFPSCCA